MGGTVAVTALGEFSEHSSRMWYAVAALAGRHHFVLILMAGYTGNCLVLGVRGSKLLIGLRVAGGTHLVGGI